MAGLLDIFSQPQPQQEERRNFIRPELLGGFGTPAIGAFLQMLDPMGLSPQQLDQNAAMRGPLLGMGYQLNPSAMQMPFVPTLPGRDSRAEDLNSVMLKFNNWRKQNAGFDLTPQERITQGFVDVRNPNSWF